MIQSFKILILVFPFFLYGQKEDKFLYEVGAEISMSLNREVLSSLDIHLYPSMKRVGYFSVTFPKPIYIETYFSANLVELENKSVNEFTDLGVLIGLNLVTKNNSAIKIAIGPYYKINSNFNYKQQNYRVGFSSRISFDINISRGIACSIIWREGLDFLGKETINQLYIGQSSLGFSFNSSINELIRKFKKNKYKNYY